MWITEEILVSNYRHTKKTCESLTYLIVQSAMLIEYVLHPMFFFFFGEQLEGPQEVSKKLTDEVQSVCLIEEFLITWPPHLPSTLVKWVELPSRLTGIPARRLARSHCSAGQSIEGMNKEGKT